MFMKVYHTPVAKQSGSDRVYHTDEDCHNTNISSLRGPKDIDCLTDEWRECKVCAGTVDKGHDGDQTLVNMLEYAEPRDFGLKEMGER